MPRTSKSICIDKVSSAEDGPPKLFSVGKERGENGPTPTGKDKE